MALVDNNILSSLAKIERLELLNATFDTVSTTTGVIDELHRVSSEGYRFVDRIDTVKHYRGGWLTVLSPTAEEMALAEDLLDSSLSSIDSKCIAIAETRELRLMTDDGHVGERASQRGVEVWDLKLLIQVAVLQGQLASKQELRTVITDLHEKGFYRFSSHDEQELYELFDTEGEPG